MAVPLLLFVRVTLAREARCECCGDVLVRGARAQLVVESSSTPSPTRVRCVPCFDAQREPAMPGSLSPEVAAVPFAATSAAASLTRVQASALVLAALAVGIVTVLATRTARRLLVTLGVAIKTGVRVLLARMRGKKKDAPAAVREAFEELGPTYVKLGQLVASSQGLFPERYCLEFQRCLDRVKPFPFPEVERTLREELGEHATSAFEHIEPEPLASASIAQVHAARLTTGEEVVVKVRRPGIEQIVRADLRILRGVARLMELVPHGELANPRAVVEDFGACLAEELDFRLEAGNMREFNRIMRVHQQDAVIAPRVIDALTTRRVLVMERFYGHRVDDVAKLGAGDVDSESKLLTGMRAWFQTMLHHGFFHGDVHAGNLMVLVDGRIGFLDFGIVGRFSRAQRVEIVDYLMSFATGDFERLARTMIAMGAADAAIDVPALAKDLATAYEPILSEGAGASVKYADLLPAILRVAVRHGLRMPRAFILVTKQMLYFDRYAKVLAPRLNIFRDPRITTALATDAFAAGLLAPQ